jgi:hypothetical protein
MPKRQSKSSYEDMSQRQLLDEVQFRELELDVDYKGYLVDVLVLNDKAYFELIDKLGDPIEAMEFAQGEVKHFNKELRRKRAVAQAAAQQTEREAHKKKREEERAKAEQLAFEEKEAKKKAKEAKQAAEAQQQVQKRRRKDSQNTDSDYSSKSTSSPGTGESGDAASVKGKKRARSNDNDTEDNTPRKKSKSSKSSQPSKTPRVIKAKRTPTTLPRAMQASVDKASSTKDEDVEMSEWNDSDGLVRSRPVKKTTKKTTQVNAPTIVPSQASTRRTRSTSVVEDPEDEDTEDADEDFEDNIDTFVEDDGYEPKRKSKIDAMTGSKLFKSF